MSRLASMTGYARAEGAADGLRWTWELRSVNAKGLDVRTRLPAGYEQLDVDVKPLLAQSLARGSISVSLTVTQDQGAQAPAINEPLLAHYAEWSLKLHERFGLPLPTGAELLALRGVLESAVQPDAEATAALARRMLPALDKAVALLARARQGEGARLEQVIAGHLDAIAALVDEAAGQAQGQPARLAERLTDALKDVLADDRRVDPDRLAQEVAMLAAKADVREELDRLTAHVAAARELLSRDEPVGRAFDFLAQEFNREANTLCSKSTTPELTSLGLALKTRIDQLREQVQNIE